LLIRHGKPEEILPSLAEAFGAHTVKWLPIYHIPIWLEERIWISYDYYELIFEAIGCGCLM
jgi:hypothetical protein